MSLGHLAQRNRGAPCAQNDGRARQGPTRQIAWLVQDPRCSGVERTLRLRCTCPRMVGGTPSLAPLSRPGAPLRLQPLSSQHQLESSSSMLIAAPLSKEAEWYGAVPRPRRETTRGLPCSICFAPTRPRRLRARMHASRSQGEGRLIGALLFCVISLLSPDISLRAIDSYLEAPA